MQLVEEVGLLPSTQLIFAVTPSRVDQDTCMVGGDCSLCLTPHCLTLAREKGEDFSSH